MKADICICHLPEIVAEDYTWLQTSPTMDECRLSWNMTKTSKRGNYPDLHEHCYAVLFLIFSHQHIPS